MSDFNKPVTTDNYSDVLDTIRGLFAHNAKQDYTGATNIPTNTKRVNSTTQSVENFNGSTWDILLSFLFTGAIIIDTGATPPSGFLTCNGAAVSRTTYANLFARISTTYGSGDGSTTFNIPDLRQRFPLGKAVSGTGAVLGSVGGAIDHVHVVKAHYHSKGNLYINASGGGTTGNNSVGHTHTGTTSTDGSHIHGFYVSSTSSVGGDAFKYRGGTGAVSDHYSPVGTQAGGSHNHTMTTGGVSSNHTHTTPAHTHTNGDFAGNVGYISGLNGDVDQNTLSNNPPFLTLNYVIKY